MKRIHVVGRKNSGKTTLVVDLVEYFRALGYRVGTIKHTHHFHELDTPGKDSYRHRQAGAEAVGIVAPAMNALFWPAPHKTCHQDKVGRSEAKGQLSPTVDDPPAHLDPPENQPRDYQSFDALMGECDLVLVEGDQQANAIKIEVWHRGLQEPPIAEQNATISLVVSNDRVGSLPVCRRDCLSSLGDKLLELAQIGSPGSSSEACISSSEKSNPEMGSRL